MTEAVSTDGDLRRLAMACNEDPVKRARVIVNEGTLLAGFQWEIGRIVREVDLRQLASPALLPARSFWGCQELQKVHWPHHLIAIGDKCFANCGLRAIDLTESRMESVGNGAFTGCRALITATLPPSLRNLGDFCFSATGVARVALKGCARLETVGVGAFRDCLEMEELAIGAGVRDMGEEAFAGCAKLSILECGSPRRCRSYSWPRRKAGGTSEDSGLLSCVVIRAAENRGLARQLLSAAIRTSVVHGGGASHALLATRPLLLESRFAA
jgi:hypothetical protein